MAAGMMTILIGLAVLCVLAYSLLGRREAWDLDEGPGLLARIRKRRDRCLRAMKDLERERESGALSPEELQALRNQYKARAVVLTKDLERARRVRLGSLLGGKRGGTPASRRKRIEDLVRARAARVPADGPEGDKI